MTAYGETVSKMEREVMAVHSRVNPTRRDYTVGEADFEGLRRREETILANLGLLPEDFPGQRVLDAGCGTGEIALLVASYGADVCGFDLNPVSVAHAARMAARAGLNGRCRFAVGSVLTPPVQGPFDIVMCLGVLAHVDNPRTGYAELSRLVRPGGYFYATHINRYGFALRRAKRAVVHVVSRGDHARKAELAEIIWRRHIERAARFGHRTKDQIAWDNFVAPHLTATVADWLRWINENGMEYVASFPCFYSFRLPSADASGVQRIKYSEPPRSRWLLSIISLAVQIRWALAFRVGGLASISFLARKPAISGRADGDMR